MLEWGCHFFLYVSSFTFVTHRCVFMQFLYISSTLCSLCILSQFHMYSYHPAFLKIFMFSPVFVTFSTFSFTFSFTFLLSLSDYLGALFLFTFSLHFLHIFFTFSSDLLHIFILASHFSFVCFTFLLLQSWCMVSFHIFSRFLTIFHSFSHFLTFLHFFTFFSQFPIVFCKIYICMHRMFFCHIS